MFNITENVVKLTIKCDDGVIMLKLLNVIVEYCESVNQYTVFIGFIPDRFLANKYPSSIYTLPSLFMSPAIIFGPVFNINPGDNFGGTLTFFASSKRLTKSDEVNTAE